jgi:hypothetical protein
MEAVKRHDPDRAWHLDRKGPDCADLRHPRAGDAIGTFVVVGVGHQPARHGQSGGTANDGDGGLGPIQSDRLTRVETRVETIQRDVTEIKSDIKSLIKR